MAFSIPAFSQYVQRLRHGKSQYFELSDRYEDEDGVATEDSESAHSDFVPRLVSFLVTVVGTLDALVFAIVITTRPQLSLMIEQWLQFATWILVLFQTSTILFATPSSVKRYNLGLLSSISSLVIVLAVAVENISLWQSRSVSLPRNIHLTLSLVQWIAAAILMITSLLIPRRPDIYLNGQVVDRQNTVSLLEKLTFTWPAPILLFASKNKGLDYTHIPEVDHSSRSHTLRKTFDSIQKRDKL